MSKERFPWRVFLVLLAAGLLGMLSLIPIGIELFRSISDKLPAPEGPFSEMPLPLIVLIGALQNILLLALIILAGLWLAKKTGLGAPIIEGWLSGEKVWPRVRQMLVPSIAAGVIVGVILTIALFLLQPRIPNLPFTLAARIAIWKRFLACFYGGLYEELLTRLFLLSLFAWLISRFNRQHEGRASAGALWTANILTAILFGLGHLPSASFLMPITPLVVTATLALNGIASLTFGYLYFKRGLEAAMLAHFTGDLIVYVVGASFA
ncbi:MAG TPA: CPBP family glutamic-type intramembrane protease [Pyrinomonadaceae bacterium]|jgi:membrane protease YdiL (CAAX protease family)|nr:CPBP family glutamic-type intramembrane protease [Pyrinomonadaceae bacterium]